MISLLCPSRERPKMAHAMAESFFMNAYNPGSIKCYFYLDEDDALLSEYKIWKEEWIGSHDTSLIEFVIGPSHPVGVSWNILTRKALQDGTEYLLMSNDDLLCETPDWDRLFRETYIIHFPDQIGILYGDDGINGSRHCAFPFLHRRWVDILGYFTPECYEFICNDTHIFDIAQRIERCVYLSSVKFRHNHWTQTRLKDRTTRRHREDTGNMRIPRDLEVYKQTTEQRKKDAERLKKVLCHP